jgi:hypothetical protein
MYIYQNIYVLSSFIICEISSPHDADSGERKINILDKLLLLEEMDKLFRLLHLVQLVAIIILVKHHLRFITQKQRKIALEIILR